jgi:putative acetyltransferase
MITLNPNRTASLIDTLTTLWEESARASHHFLSEQDIQNFISFVKMGLAHIDLLAVAYDGDKPTAFMGVESDKIEMLFVSPLYFGKGIGTELIKLALEKYAVKYVDVNEQNPQATGFYQHIGFEVFERTALDEQGNPFPILKMRLSEY